MKASIIELIRLIHKPYVALGIISAILISAIAIDTVGYLVWRSFPLPLLIITTALIWIGIGRSINQPELSRIVRVLAIGLCAFGVTIFLGAFADAMLWPEMGYLTFAGRFALWLWIAFESYRGWQVLTTMPEESRVKITMSTAEIIAQMTATQHRIERVVADSTRILRETRVSSVK